VSFLGRILKDPTVRLMTITGRGGVGKSRLARELASERAASVPGSSCVVDVSTVRVPDLVMPHIVSALGITMAPGADASDVLARHLAHTECLLVLDGFEHVVSAGALLGVLLARCDGLRVLVTSQRPLRVNGERIITLPGLELPAVGWPGPGDDLAAQPAVNVYCDHATLANDSFAFGSHNAAAIAELTRELEGLPLAIELAATRAGTLSAQDILGLLPHQRLDVVRVVRHDFPSRHHDVRSAIVRTYQLLEPDAQALLRRLSVVVGSFDVADVHNLLDNPSDGVAVDALSSLVDARLAEPVAGLRLSRWVLTPSIRAVAVELLIEAAELDVSALRRRSWLALQGRRAAGSIDGPDERIWRVWLDHTHNALFAALLSCLAEGELELALDLVHGLVPYWDRRGFTPVHQRAWERVIAEALDKKVTGRCMVQVLCWSSLAGITLGGRDRPRHERHLRYAEQMARSTGSVDLLLLALGCWITAAPTTGDFAQANAAATEGLALAVSLGLTHRIARFEVSMGLIAHEVGDDARALALARSGLASAYRDGDIRTTVYAAFLLISLADTQPHVSSEIPPLEELLAMARFAEQTKVESLLLQMLSAGSVAMGDIRQAADWCTQGLRLAAGAESSRPGAAFGLMAAVEIAANRGDALVAARFQGMLQISFPRLAANVAAAKLAHHKSVMAAIELSIGQEAMMAASESGARMHWSAALNEALHYIRPLAETLRIPPQRLAPSVLSPLTARQRDVARLLATGLKNKEIGEQLGVTTKTVMHHTSEIYRRLGVRGRNEATALLVRAGVL
jgi:predicted ATPase/DNA-binding CsgD family transcriptional regulator